MVEFVPAWGVVFWATNVVECADELLGTEIVGVGELALLEVGVADEVEECVVPTSLVREVDGLKEDVE